MWTYKGLDIWPHDRNSMGLRWYAYSLWDDTPKLRADSKAGMRALINEALKAHGLTSAHLPQRESSR